MNTTVSLILGIVEGVTEFLPVSSTAHLIIASNILHITQTEFQKFFEVFIQAGAILAVIFIYLKYLLEHKEILGKVIVSFIPTSIIGLVLYKIIKTVFFESNMLIIFSIFSIGIVFLITEYYVKKGKLKLNKNIADMGFITAVIIGLAQSLAVVPGVSRAGIVMVAMILLGYKREDSATYSFLLAVPTILAASVLDVYKMREVVFSSGSNLPFLIIGFVMSFVTALFAVKWLINYLKTNSLTIFGIYRILLAIILLVTLIG